MRLKSLDVQGFKSFADKTQLDFNDGITAVIGPNGSGKSNIADAIRWVLGEQSTKTLRGGKMEDVIFGGTQARKSMGVASVTLNIDNTDRSLSGFECDEVAITRRLYRSGESEYRINGSPVRLRDINELFMDTGLGRDGYSIIGQGRVAEIVSARSKERREIFEEAAGISKFRYRKTEAERRLALAEDNLLRLRDILSELESRLAPLKTQSEKAQKFLELAGEKKLLEVSVWLQNIRLLRERAAAVEDKLLLAQNDYSAAEQAAAECERLFNEETERGRQLMLSIEQQREAINERARAAAEYTSQCAVLKNDIEHHERSIEEITEQIAQAGLSKEQLLRQLAEVQNSLSAEKKELKEQESRKVSLSGEMKAAAEKQAEYSAQLEKLRSRRAGAYEAIEAAKLDAAAAASLLGESAERIEYAEKNREEREKAVLDAEKDIKECEKLLDEIAQNIQSLENSAKGYMLKQNSRSQKVEEFDRKISELSDKSNGLKQKAKLLSDMDKNMEGFGQAVKFIMNRARAGAIKGIHGPVSTLIRVADSHTTAIETALGAAMQNIVVDNEETGKRAISLLKDAKAGRATFLPLTSVKGSRLDTNGIENMFGFVGLGCELVGFDERYSGIITSLLGRVVVAEDLDSAVTIAKKHGYRFRVVTLDGQVVNAGGSMTGGYAVKSAGILGRQGETERLLKEAEKLDSQAKQLGDMRESAFRELAAVNAELDAVFAQKKTCEEDRIRCHAEQNAAQLRYNEAVKQMQTAKLEREQLSARIEEMKRKSADSEELTAGLSAELEKLQGEIAELSEQNSRLAERYNLLSAEQSDCVSKILLLNKDIENSSAEEERIKAQMSESESVGGERQQRINSLRGMIADAQSRIKELTAMAEQSKSGEAQAQQQVIAEMQRREQSEKRCVELRQREKQESERRDGLYREVVRLTEQKNSAESERDSIIAKLYDEYELTRTDAEEIAQPIEDISSANRRLAELKNRIRALGSVNVDAIEEYKEVFERHGELSRQLDDVESSKAELNKLINELTETMCSIFSEKFEAINRNFGVTFRELFEGGSASLSLTEPDNVLESGIEITVHPPGKLIKNLAALSGGEQSFVAIAIFFSILKVNPSPFCLMDEIEAALDDVNVVRFAQYLHRLTDKTQFIAITHRRGTMEEADVLYGVTMQEEGISKLLQLRVSEIEKGFGVTD